MAEFLFEIGLEEIPARMIEVAQAELQSARSEDAGARAAGAVWCGEPAALLLRGGWPVWVDGVAARQERCDRGIVGSGLR